PRPALRPGLPPAACTPRRRCRSGDVEFVRLRRQQCLADRTPVYRAMTHTLPAFPFTLDRQAIEQLLPHRGPIFACQQLIATGPRRYTAIAHWPLDNAVVQGHFPGYPLVPGVMLI